MPVFIDIHAIHENSTRSCFLHRDQYAHEARLACAIGSQQSKHTAAYLQIYISNGCMTIGIYFRKSGYLNIHGVMNSFFRFAVKVFKSTLEYKVKQTFSFP